MTSHYCIIFCRVPEWRWSKRAETCTRFNTCLFIFVYNSSAIVTIYSFLS